MNKNQPKVLVAMSGPSINSEPQLHTEYPPMDRNNIRVLVAMSGGVDSSVAAAVLKKQGYAIIGATLKLFCYAKNNLQKKACCSAQAINDAKAVCAKLNAPHYVLDCEKLFKKQVINYFVRELRSGHTPNPCIFCNQFVKFGFLIKYADRLNANYIATGHYAIVETQNLVSHKLKQARDKSKDQSYFLYTLTQAQLKRILFPLGDYTKKQVREMAERFGLPVAQKTESQEICFIGKEGIAGFLKKYIKLKQGDIVDEQGKVLGQHDGLPLYTIGQRHGIKIGGTGPYYVIGKKTRANKLVVTNKKDDPLLYSGSLAVKNVNWISGKAPKFPFACQARIRYQGEAVGAVLNRGRTFGTRLAEASAKRAEGPTSVFVQFSTPQRAATSGQAAVFYKGGEVIGGGIIV